jgi:hypothetical protein
MQLATGTGGDMKLPTCRPDQRLTEPGVVINYEPRGYSLRYIRAEFLSYASSPPPPRPPAPFARFGATRTRMILQSNKGAIPCVSASFLFRAEGRIVVVAAVPIIYRENLSLSRDCQRVELKFPGEIYERSSMRKARALA